MSRTRPLPGLVPKVQSSIVLFMPQNKAEMLITSDDLGRTVRVSRAPQRIVSLCPSQTETLLTLGLGGQIVGRTRYCIHPKHEVSQITDIGGTKNPKIEAILALEPDLVIAEKEENRPEDVAALEGDVPVYVTDVCSIPGALAMVRRLGKLCLRSSEAEALAQQIEERWRELSPLSTPKTVAYLIWRKPWMVAGSDTYICDVLERCGLENVFAGRSGRYPETTVEEIAKFAPGVVLLSSEPYPFTDVHTKEFASRLPKSKVLRVDGEAFSWYGARMLKAADELQAIIKSLSS
ncbi:MAG: cobalamin-binding protein [Nevskiales bacterium]